MAVLTLERVEKRFGGVAAVNGVDFEIAGPGETLGLVGPNGAGKTTIVNLVNGLLTPDRGRILLEGTDLIGLGPARRTALGVARTFQVPRPFGRLNCRENVAVAAMFSDRTLPQARANEMARELLAELGLGARAEDSPSELTVAQLKKLEIARALAGRPKVVLMDEPFSGLNAKELEEGFALLSRLKSRGVAVLLIEHLVKFVAGVCDRIVVLHHGRKLAEGPPYDVINSPEVVEAFLGKRQGRWGKADAS